MKRLMLLTLSVLLLLASCKKDDNETLDYVLNKTSLTLKQGESFQFEVTQGGKKISAENFRWFALPTDVGAVNGGGWFHADNKGKVTVRVEHRSEPVELRCEVTVN